MLSSQARIAPQLSASTRVSRPQRLSARASSEGDIYIGFPKDDYKPRQGRQGRIIKDDPSKYPQRNEFSGGWAGGETGLKQFVEVAKAQGAPLPPKAAKAAAKEAKPIGRGKDTIYIGKGRTLVDDARKYPQRNELTGGFAGGELGLRAFLDKGDVPIAEPGAPQRRQPPSPLIVAGAVSVIGTIAALLVGNLEVLLKGPSQ